MRRLALVGPAEQDKVKAIYIAAQWLRAQGVDVHVDHILPIAADGSYAVENLSIVPASYNLQKSDKVL